MLMLAHVKAHDFFGGLCLRGIYENAKTVVDKIGRGTDRLFNKRFYCWPRTICLNRRPVRRRRAGRRGR